MRIFKICAAALLASFGSFAFAQNIAISNVSQAEGNAASNFQFQISVNPVSATDITVQFETLATGSATAGSDYTAVAARTVTIPANTATVNTAVSVLGDTIVEAAETFEVRISAASAGTIVTSQALGTINNDDSSTLSIASITQAEGNAANNMSFAVTLSNAVQGAVSVRVTSADGTAVAPSDYLAFNQVVNIASGALTQNFTVAIVGDSMVEATEQFTLAMSNLVIPASITPANVILSANPITGTLNNDDSAAITVASASIAEGNSGTTPLNFAVSLSNPIQGAVSFSFQSVDGTATVADNDYQAATGTVSFASNSTTATPIAVNVLGDTRLENNETFQVTLGNLQLPAGIAAASVQLQTAPVVGTISNDDAITISSANLRVTEADGGTGTFPLNVTLSAPSALPVSVNFATQNLTAQAGFDYVAQSGVLTFAPGQLQQQIQLQIVGDLRDETDETFAVNFSNATPAAPLVSLQTPSVTITIGDTDAVIPVPSLNLFGLMLMLLMFGAIGMWTQRRN